MYWEICSLNIFPSYIIFYQSLSPTVPFKEKPLMIKDQVYHRLKPVAFMLHLQCIVGMDSGPYSDTLEWPLEMACLIYRKSSDKICESLCSAGHGPHAPHLNPVLLLHNAFEHLYALLKCIMRSGRISGWYRSVKSYNTLWTNELPKCPRLE